MKPTAEQLLIKEAVQQSTVNLQIIARAGSGKTTTLCLIAKQISGPGTAISFNKKIAEELKERLPANFESATMHSLGFRALREFFGRFPKLYDKKMYDILQDVITNYLSPEEQEEIREEFRETLEFCRMAKDSGYLPDGVYTQAKPLQRDLDFFDEAEISPTGLQLAVIKEVISRSFRDSLAGTIDFSDMVYLPALLPVSFPKKACVMVDEAQDLSLLNHALLRKIAKGARVIAVGDPCQPDGTLVTRVIERANRWHPAKLEQVPIEEIKEGDIVLGYNGEGAFLYDRQVEGITRRPYEGQLVSVTGSGFASRYTPNHHCYASFEPLRNRHALYLMQRGDVFRMGICKMDYGNMGSGPIVRARHEDADAVWLLETYETEREAFKHEAFYQAKFGIPDLTFLEPSSNFDRGFLSSFWAMCESLNLDKRARECLAFFGRDYAYPLWEKGQPYTSLKRPTVTYACNLLSGCLLLPFTGESKVTQAAWQPINVGREPYVGFVTSFTISDNHLYVADSLVTHNCQAIYAFRGADEESMEKMRHSFSMTPFYLTICFRSAQAVVKNARWRAPDMQWREGAPEGKVQVLQKWSAADIADGDAIICRNNAPLFSTALALIKEGRMPELSSGDLAKSLGAIFKKLGKGNLTQDQALASLEEWKEKNRIKYKSTARLDDTVECIRIFLEARPTLGEAILHFEQIIARSGRIKLLTGHKSKGLEFDRVFFLDRHVLKPEGQDLNIRYVIETRAREELFYVDRRGFQYGDVCDTDSHISHPENSH